MENIIDNNLKLKLNPIINLAHNYVNFLFLQENALLKTHTCMLTDQSNF